MTDNERSLVESELRRIEGRPGGCYVFSYAGLGIFATALLTVLLNSFLRLPGWMAVALLTSGTLAGFLIGRRSLRLSIRKLEPPHRHDLEQGTVEVIRCTVLDAVMVDSPDPADGAPPSYFLDVGDSRLLYIDLEETAEAELGEPANFPVRELCLTRSPRAGVALGLECLGEEFAPSRVRDWLIYRLEYWPRWGEVLPGSLATLEADLRRLATERPANY
jgi:hypothetical protein